RGPAAPRARALGLEPRRPARRRSARKDRDRDAWAARPATLDALRRRRGPQDRRRPLPDAADRRAAGAARRVLRRPRSAEDDRRGGELARAPPLPRPP